MFRDGDDRRERTQIANQNRLRLLLFLWLRLLELADDVSVTKLQNPTRRANKCGGGRDLEGMRAVDAFGMAWHGARPLSFDRVQYGVIRHAARVG